MLLFFIDVEILHYIIPDVRGIYWFNFNVFIDLF